MRMGSVLALLAVFAVLGMAARGGHLEDEIVRQERRCASLAAPGMVSYVVSRHGEFRGCIEVREGVDPARPHLVRFVPVEAR